ncbi:S8/S53 family peptidase [Halopseudomonas sp. SMJS2]|uniref:S8/S53 family peptidase n=1 Tax=Halopseudomonas sp. SMJS2 TaxID=3041098 RepID=UPI002452AC57|nr:S8/S53 family peptidase [Halopseudomonas sp. SMJS2]WGK61501.1 S8/S53 family peptidase [Halopseudomonas sp. SMJS2]
MRKFRAVVSGLVMALSCVSINAAAAAPLRITQLQRCGDLLETHQLTFCLQIAGLQQTPLQIQHNGNALPSDQIRQGDGQIQLQIDAASSKSGPLWVEQRGQASNPIWLSLGSSHVLAADQQAVARNQDGLTTYLDLISVIIEESHDAPTEARRLAERYDAEVVGAIPPLNLYQLRLPVDNLEQRDAAVLRIGNEVGVDAVVIEESGAEESVGQEQDAANPPMDPREEWSSNRFLDALNFYQRRLKKPSDHIETHPVRIGVIERDVDFDTPDFADYLGDCRSKASRTCVYGRDAATADGHGTTVTGVLAAGWGNGGSNGFLRGLDEVGPGFDVIVDRGSDAGITANVATSVNLVEDGARVLNWSWGMHRIGARDIHGDPVDSLLRSGIAMSGYEELLEEFFLWLRREHPDVVVVNSAGNGASFSSRDDYRLPSSFITDQLFVVGGHQRSSKDVDLDDPHYATRRQASNSDMRVDITAAACTAGSSPLREQDGPVHCGTSYATPLVAGTIAAMLSINPELQPDQLRMLLRRSAMTIGGESDFEPMEADDLTAPILPSERGNNLQDPDIGHSARLDMYKALELAVESLKHAR